MDVQVLETDYAGRRKQLFPLAMSTSILTVFTLGFYRFWMKTRLRRYYWSAIRLGGIPLEYTGTGIEKLMGFLVAVVVMAFYIGVFNLVLMFLSFSLLNDNFVAYASSFIGIIPIYFYAQYRARRYVLARTRWRGLRLGVDPAAWSYAWRALVHWGLTILTLGVLLPRQIWWLEKFRVDRTWFGRARFAQTGRWTCLLGPARHYFIGLALTGSAIGLFFVNEMCLLLLFPGLPWLAFGYLTLRVQSFRVMAAHKQLGEGIRFRAEPRTGRVLGIYVLGYLLAGSIVAGVSVLVIAILAFVAGITGADLFEGGASTLSQGVLVSASIIAYFAVFVFWGVLTQVFVTLPVMRHYAETIKILSSHHLASIRQRPRDEFSEAEGFAEALDIGAAI